MDEAWKLKVQWKLEQIVVYGKCYGYPSLILE